MKILHHIEIGFKSYLNTYNMKKLIKKLKFKLFGGEVEEDIINIDDIDENDNLVSVINPKIVIHHSNSGYTYPSYNINWSSMSGQTSVEEPLDYKEFRRKQLKDELMNDTELLMIVLSDLREEKINKIKK